MLVKIRFRSKTSKSFTTCQILNELFYNASDLKTKVLQRVRFRFKNFTMRQLLKNIYIFEKHDFEEKKIFLKSTILMKIFFKKSRF